MKKRPEKGGGARATILDSAEALFARSGYDGVPVREIAKHAEVGLSLVTYHFASKEQLFEEVLARRADVLNAMRREALETFVKGQDGDLRRLVEAYTKPFLVMMANGDEHWKNYGELIAQVAQTSKHTPLVVKYYDETGRLFADALTKIYPDANREDVIRSVVYSVDVMLSIFSSIRRVETLSMGEFTSVDANVAYPSMVDFICGGVDAILSGGSSRKT